MPIALTEMYSRSSIPADLARFFFFTPRRARHSSRAPFTTHLPLPQRLPAIVDSRIQGDIRITRFDLQHEAKREAQAPALAAVESKP
jgi:hypothetical protein